MGDLQYQDSTRFASGVRGLRLRGGANGFVLRENALEFGSHALHHTAAAGGAARARGSIADIFEVVINGEFFAGFDRAHHERPHHLHEPARDQTRRGTHRRLQLRIRRR